MSNSNASKQGVCSELLWIDKILHHLETMGNNFSLVFTGDHHSRACQVVQDFVHPQYRGVCKDMQFDVAS